MKGITKFFYDLYVLFVFLPLFLILTILTALATTIGCSLGGEKVFSYYPGMIWSRLTCLLALCPVKVSGGEKLDRSRSYVFVSNHQGAFDIFLLYGYLGQPVKWIMKQSLRKIPLVGKACESAGFIFVDRSSAQAAARSVLEAEKKLKSGASVVLFPEGTRSLSGKLGRFKRGAFQMALDLKIPIVPVTINGSFEIMPRNSHFLHPHRMELILHDPIDVSSYSAGGVKETLALLSSLSEQSRKEISDSLAERYR